jgi:hypothetical protein
MIVLGTPSVDLDIGIPWWVVFTALIVAYFLYVVGKKLNKRFAGDDEISEEEE